MAAFTIACIVLGMKARDVRIQRKAVAAIQSAGGTVAYDDQYNCDIRISPNSLVCGRTTFKRNTVIPIVLDKYLGRDFFATVVRVDLKDTDTNDDLLSKLKVLDSINTLHLDRTKITDESLKKVDHFRHLKILSLQGTSITNQGLAQLQNLEQLEYISLGGTKITDNGLANLGRFSRLRVLKLDNTISLRNGVHKRTRATNITNQALDYLNGLQQLEWVSIGGTDINSDGTKLLQQSLPKLSIVH